MLNYKEGIKKILDRREDMSSLVFHFTKEAYCFETLCEILKSGYIKDISNKGYLCFTEAPILMLKPLFEYFIDLYPDRPMYAPYGIGISKNALFKIGGRPVIYGKPEERKLLNKAIEWRHVDINLPDTDYTWLREWRIKKNKIKIKPNNSIIVTRTEKEIEICNEFLNDDYSKQNKYFTGISMEKLEEIKSNKEILTHLRLQLNKY